MSVANLCMGKAGQMLLLVTLACAFCSVVSQKRDCSNYELEERHVFDDGWGCRNIFDAWYYREILLNGQRLEQLLVKRDVDKIREKRQVSSPNTPLGTGKLPVLQLLAEPEPPLEENELPYENTTLWARVCSRWRAASICYSLLAEDCDESFGFEAMRNRTYNWGNEIGWSTAAYAFYDRLCEGRDIKPTIRALVDSPDRDLSCVTPEFRGKLIKCFEFLSYEISSSTGDVRIIYEGLKSYYDNLAINTLKCARSLIRTSTCNDVTRKLVWELMRAQLHSFFILDDLNVDEIPPFDFANALRCSVGVYGDPHLKYCFQPRLEVCSAPGRQVYISNRYFDVIGTNVLLSSLYPGNLWLVGSLATTIAKLEIIFRDLSGSQIGTYTVSEGYPDDTFDDGSLQLPNVGKPVTMATPPRLWGRRIIIYPQLGAVFIIRGWNHRYFFTLRMAENVVRASSGLLVIGCPQEEVLGNSWRVVGGPPPGNKKRHADCATMCQNTADKELEASCIDEYCSDRNKRAIDENDCFPLCDVIQDAELKASCMYDCVETGDLEMLNMTLSTPDDIMEAESKDLELIASAIKIIEDNGASHMQAGFLLGFAIVLLIFG